MASPLTLLLQSPRALTCALSLSMVLVVGACRTTPNPAPSRAEELVNFVLIIQEAPDGHISHRWQRSAEFDLPQYNSLSSIAPRPGHVMLASHRQRDCDQEQIDCYRSCMKRRLPSHLSHIQRGSGAHGSYCANTCLKEYMECLKLQNHRALEFSVASDAVEWVKRNRKELLVGSVVVIAGVVFVTLSAGAGLIILAPVALVSSSGAGVEQQLAGVPS